jgi:hypothetical protein
MVTIMIQIYNVSSPNCAVELCLFEQPSLLSLNITVHSLGNIHIVNNGMSVIYSFQAYTQKVTHITMLKSRNIMVTIGVSTTAVMCYAILISDIDIG